MQSDTFSGNIDIKYDVNIRNLSDVNPYYGLLHVSFQWVLVISFIIAADFLLNKDISFFILIPIYILSIAFIASRQHALGILLHEAVHQRVSKSRWLNDFIGEWFIAWPLHVTLYGYREQHFAHHRNVGKSKDPDQIRMDKMDQYNFPKSKKDIYIIVLKYIFCFYSFEEFRAIMKELVIPVPLKLHLERFIAYGFFITALIYYNIWFEYILYWYIPMVTFSLLYLYIRIVGEHRALPVQGDIFGTTRHVIPKWWEKIFISPYHVNYHLDHHLFPSVPFYNLPKLHAYLMNNPFYKERVHITSDGYWKGLMMKECTLRS